jgi:hypothetical protein
VLAASEVDVRRIRLELDRGAHLGREIWVQGDDLLKLMEYQSSLAFAALGDLSWESS